MNTATQPRDPSPRARTAPGPSEDALNMVGKELTMTSGDLLIRVKITDARNRYGNTDYLVTPVAGSGHQWVQATRLN